MTNNKIEELVMPCFAGKPSLTRVTNKLQSGLHGSKNGAWIVLLKGAQEPISSVKAKEKKQPRAEKRET